MVWIILLAILAILVVAYIMIYNNLVQLRTHGQEAWSQIDVQLQRRNDLIPNLLETVKGYSKYEQDVLTKVTSLRSAVMNADSREEKMAKSNELTSTLKTLFAVNENYPDLKASSQYQQLMEELANTENKIAYSRQLYNSVAATLNANVQSFPSNIVAKLHHFEQLDYLQVPEEAKQVPKVKF